MTRKQAALHGFGWGCIAGLALVALMYLAGLVLGLCPLPQLLNEPLLSLMRLRKRDSNHLTSAAGRFCNC